MINLTDSQRSFFKQKCYFLKLVTYLDNFVEIIVANSDKIKKYAYCTHDKDMGKKKHTHIILAFTTDQTLLKYVKLFNTTEVAPLDKKGLKPMYDYLIHDTPQCRAEGKYLYDVSCRKSNDHIYFNPPKRVKLCDNISDMLDDILRLSRRSFAVKYGFNGIIHYDKILQFSLRCVAEDNAIANGSQIQLDLENYVVNQSSGELAPVKNKKISKFLKNHLTPID